MFSIHIALLIDGIWPILSNSVIVYSVVTNQSIVYVCCIYVVR